MGLLMMLLPMWLGGITPRESLSAWMQQVRPLARLRKMILQMG
jgi:hypothetical protein